MNGALTITDAELRALCAARVEAVLTDEKLAALAQAEITARIGLLTMGEAQARLRCPSRKALRELCRRYGIEVVDFGPKKQLIRLASVEAVLRARSVVPADTEAPTGTRVGGLFPALAPGTLERIFSSTPKL